MARINILEKLKLNGIWDNMTPAQRRNGVVLLGVCGAILAIAMFSGADTKKPVLTARESVKRSVLTDADTRSIGIDSLNAKVKSVERENDDLRAKLDRVNKELDDMQKRRGNDPDVMREMQIMQSQIAELTGTAKTIGWDVEDIKTGNVPLNFSEPPGAGVPQNDVPEDHKKTLAEMKAKAEKAQKEAEEKRSEREARERPLDVNSYFSVPPIRAAQPMAGGNPSQPGSDTKKTNQPLPAMQIIRVQSKTKAADDDSKDDVYLPAGSIVSGVLVNGIDAATGRGAKNDPFPVLVRIQKDAILPNQYRADISECFATLSGYGELSSERVMLRGEKFSCITKDGSVIEENFPAYAVGNDAVAGLRGTLVSRAGSLIAKAGLAGFASGVAQAFGGSPVPVIQTGAIDGQRQYQSNINADSVNYGVSQGAKAAAERLADYYMDMADQMFSVITVDAGRPVDIVLTNGFTLKMKSNKKVAQNINGTRPRS